MRLGVSTKLHTITVAVNDVMHTADVEARLLLVDFLRHRLRLTGTHVGCSHGVCGACTILLDGRTARSCLTFAVQVNGRKLHTVEYLARDGRLSALQQEFHRHHALQCGYCTPGMLMSAYALLAEDPILTRQVFGLAYPATFAVVLDTSISSAL